MKEKTWYGVFDGLEEDHRVLAAYDDGSSYDGWGAALARDSRGFWVADYGHCSSNAPEDTSRTLGPFKTVEEALRHLGGDDAATLRGQLAAVQATRES